MASALIAQELAEKRQLGGIPLVFTAALLKDIGKVILNRHVKDSFEEIIRAVREKQLTFIEAEKQIISCSMDRKLKVFIFSKTD